jgi:hypothetical protein
MTPAQKAAMDRVIEADGQPVRITAGTARVLSEQYRYLTPQGDGWVLTDIGRTAMSNDSYWSRLQARKREIPRASRDYGERVVMWLKAHNLIGTERLDDGSHWQHYYTAHNYAEHYAACLHAGLEPVRPLGEPEWIEEHVKGAIDCLAAYDKANERATARGVCVEIDYSVADSVPQSRREAAVQRPDGSVDLRVYRLRRGQDAPGGAA